ncbi:hypothetical protein [Rhodovulum euryhalinum]|uniref:Uncharacterized protein n=1 Tax=Rhodovulum euryhalinum TaxID=35805 RepID=A0A4R2K9Y9_9RHOB|nr:hypothetical protein [Rhodovulum euryhalinum]TCO70243.1 hypothetical protein EV655_1107 [Rhodovulum euryhalinum]
MTESKPNGYYLRFVDGEGYELFFRKNGEEYFIYTRPCICCGHMVIGATENGSQVISDDTPALDANDPEHSLCAIHHIVSEYRPPSFADDADIRFLAERILAEARRLKCREFCAA